MPKRDDDRPDWWYTSANPQTIFQESIKAPDTPGLEAPTLTGTETQDDPFLPPMTA